MKKIKLVAKTKFGKEKIKKDGDVFLVSEIRDNLPCFNGATGMLIISDCSGSVRWIRMKNDENFKWSWIKI